MSNQVKFVWEGTGYTIPEDITVRKILLPSGVVLEFKDFLHSFPPQLAELKAASFTVSAKSMTDMTFIAEQLQAVLATELGYCPEHPEEHGIFCSKCGKPIHPPMPLAPKPPFPLQGSVTPVDVQGNGPCPTCKQPLDHEAHASSCPNCGQVLHWTCR